MKKLLSLLFILSIFVLTGCSLEPEQKEEDVLQAAQNRGKFIIGVSYDSKPFGFINKSGKPDGFDVDIAKVITKTILGNENAIEFVETKGYDSISMVAAGKVDFLIAATTITPQRKLTVDFSDPYYTAGQAILVPPKSKIKNVRDLNNKKVIVQLNSTAEKTPKKYAPAAILIGFKSHQLAFDAFKKGNGDAIISDDSLLKGFVIDNPAYKILPSKLSIEPYGIVMKNGKEASALRTEINTILQQMRTDGTLDKLKQKWKV